MTVVDDVCASILAAWPAKCLNTRRPVPGRAKCPSCYLMSAFYCDARHGPTPTPCYTSSVILGLGVSPMRRREFITIVSGAAASWPLAARAQQPGKLPTIGFLGTTTPSAWSQWVAAFVQRLRDFGWIDGRTIAIEYRWAEGRAERFAEIAAEFVRLKVDVIVSTGAASREVMHATSVIPVVFALWGDPIGSGYIASLSPPQIRLCGRDIPVGSCRSASRRTGSATAIGEQSACPECPWHATAA